MSSTNLRQEVFKYMDKHPKCTNAAIKDIFNLYNGNSVATYRTQWMHKKNKLDNVELTPEQEELAIKKIAEGFARREKIKSLSIKAKLMMAGEKAIDKYILDNVESRILPKAMDLLSKDEFLNQGEIIHDMVWPAELEPYSRPKFLYDHQLVAMNLMDLGHLLWQASRQFAGKTTAGLLKDCEDMVYNKNYTIALVAPTVPLATELLMKFFNSTIMYEGKVYTFYSILKPYFLKDPNQLGFRFKNGSRLMILSLKQAGSQGRTIDVIHIEELDKLGQEANKRAGLAGIINSIRANPNAKIRVFCNDAKGIFRLLKQELFKLGHYFSIFIEDPFSPDDEYSGRHTIINENVIVEKPPTLDNILYIFSEILVSAAFAEGQLYNVEDVTDECFNPDMVEAAYNKKLTDPIYVKTKMGIDPGGKKNAFGVSIWSLTSNGIIVLRWCKRFYNSLHTAQEQAKIIAEQIIRYRVEHCQAESSAGSAWSMSLIADEVHKQSGGKIKFKYWFVNFSGEGTIFDKSNFVYLFKILLDYGYIVLKRTNKEEKELLHQITLYEPNKRESGTNPDDLVESGFHGIWDLLGGLKYIKVITDRIKRKIVITTRE